MQSKVHALQSCPCVLSSSEFVVGLITASWSEGAGACFAPGVTCLFSLFLLELYQCSLSFLQKTCRAHSLSFRRPTTGVGDPPCLCRLSGHPSVLAALPPGIVEVLARHGRLLVPCSWQCWAVFGSGGSLRL